MHENTWWCSKCKTTLQIDFYHTLYCECVGHWLWFQQSLSVNWPHSWTPKVYPNE